MTMPPEIRADVMLGRSMGDVQCRILVCGNLAGNNLAFYAVQSQ
jgi:hypothetical protein